MPIFSGSTNIPSIYSGSNQVLEVYSGSTLVWTNVYWDYEDFGDQTAFAATAQAGSFTATTFDCTGPNLSTQGRFHIDLAAAGIADGASVRFQATYKHTFTGRDHLPRICTSTSISGSYLDSNNTVIATGVDTFGDHTFDVTFTKTAAIAYLSMYCYSVSNSTAQIVEWRELTLKPG